MNASANLTDAASTTAPSTAKSPGILGTFVPTPIMLSAVAVNDGNNIGLDCNDTVKITFSGQTNEPNFVANINTWLKLTLASDPNTSHAWTNASSPSSAISCSWNSDANVLTVRFKSNTGATIKVCDKLTLNTAAHLKDYGNTTPDSNCFVIITGTFTSIPTITSLVASNDGNNLNLGVGDKVKITFNQSTNKPAIDANNLDSLFPIASGDLWGAATPSWDANGKVLTFTFTDVSSSTIWIGDTITIDPSANIMDALSTTSPSTVSSTLTGSFSSVPKIVSVVAANDGNNAGFGLGDTVTITFNEPTNMMNNLLTPANINSWLKLSNSGNSHSWGTGIDSNGIVWDANGDQLKIIFDISVSGATITAKDKVTIDANAGLKDPNSTTLSCTSDCNMIGAFTWAPQIVSTVATNDGNAPGLNAGDKVKITFDQKTNTPTVTSANINTWFKLYSDPNNPNTRHSWGTNSSCVGTPTWDANSKVLTIQISSITGSTIAVGDTLVIDANAGLKDAGLTTGVSTNSCVLGGSFTSPPAIISAIASNDGNNIGLGAGDKVTITFDQNTNMSAIAPTNINSWLRPSSGHIWGTGLDGSNPDVNIRWDPNGRILTIVFNSVTGSTITALDTITVDANAGLMDEANTIATASTAMAKMSGSFTSAPQIVSAVAYNSGSNYGIGSGDKVVITFDQPTNQDPNFKKNLATALKLGLATDPNNTSHVWGTASGNTINTISDANWDANGVVFTIIFNSTATSAATVRANDKIWVNSTTLKDVGNTIVASSNKVTMTGTFTNSMGIISAVATSGGIPGSDANSNVQLTFNQNSNKPTISTSNIDNLLKLSNNGQQHTWSTVSSAAWNTNGNKLTITYSNAVGSPTIAIGDTIAIDPNANITDTYSTTNACCASSVLTGTFNTPPAILSVVIANGSGTLGVLDVGDTITITFDQSTNRPIIFAGNLDNDLVLSKGHSWGTALQDTSISWTDSSHLLIALNNTQCMTLAVGDTVTINAEAGIQDAAGTTAASTSSKAATGSF